MDVTQLLNSHPPIVQMKDLCLADFFRPIYAAFFLPAFFSWPIPFGVFHIGSLVEPIDFPFNNLIFT